MNELTRAQYLEALGIDTFVPRFVLPAAKAPALCELPAANDQSSMRSGSVENQSSDVFSSDSSVATVAEHAGPTKSALAITNLLEGNASEPTVGDEIGASESNSNLTSSSSADLDNQSLDQKQKLEAVIDAATRHVKTEDDATFSLGVWQCKDLLFVDSRRAGQALPTQALLVNILLSVGVENVGAENVSVKKVGVESNALSKEEILNWPLVQHNSDQSWTAARAMVTSFLDGRLFSRPCSKFLILGKDAYRATVGDESHYLEQLYAEITIESFEAKALILPSLSDLLYKPELKRAVWIALHNFCES